MTNNKTDKHFSKMADGSLVSETLTITHHNIVGDELFARVERLQNDKSTFALTIQALNNPSAKKDLGVGTQVRVRIEDQQLVTPNTITLLDKNGEVLGYPIFHFDLYNLVAESIKSRNENTLNRIAPSKRSDNILNFEDRARRIALG